MIRTVFALHGDGDVRVVHCHRRRMAVCVCNRLESVFELLCSLCILQQHMSQIETVACTATSGELTEPELCDSDGHNECWAFLVARC